MNKRVYVFWLTPIWSILIQTSAPQSHASTSLASIQLIQFLPKHLSHLRIHSRADIGHLVRIPLQIIHLTKVRLFERPIRNRVRKLEKSQIVRRVQHPNPYGSVVGAALQMVSDIAMSLDFGAPEVAA